MKTPHWQDLLQQHLDGTLGRDEMSAHVPPGADQKAVGRLLIALDHLEPPAPSPALADRVTACLREAARDRRRHHRRRLAPAAGLVAAAALLLLLGLRVWWPTRNNLAPSDPAPVSRAPRMDSPAEPLGDSVSRAGSALASLTTQTAGATVEQTSTLLPLITAQALPPLPPTMETPLDSFREASTGVSTGLAPVANSAQRAVQLFLRDLPMGKTTAH